MAVTDSQLIASAAFVRLQLPLASVSWQDASDASKITLPHRQLGTSTGALTLVSSACTAVATSAYCARTVALFSSQPEGTLT